MKIHKWQISHSYSSYMDNDYVDIDYIACKLVKCGVAFIAFRSDCSLYLNYEGHVYRDKCLFEDMGAANSSKYIPPQSEAFNSADPAIHDYVLQCLLFYNSERKILNLDENISPKYLRAYLGPIKLINKDKNIDLVVNTSLVIYETGVLYIEYVVDDFEKRKTIDVDIFIEEKINFYQHSFETILLNSNISKIGVKKGILSTKNNFMRRALAVLKVNMLQTVIEKNCILLDFCKMYNISTLIGVDTLSSLSIEIFSIVNFLSSRHHNFTNYVLLNIIHEYCNIKYFGRSHTYITKFVGQQNTASLNEELHSESIKKLQYRSVGFRKDKLDTLHSNRSFDDYSCYIERSHSLWIWSKEGLSAESNYIDHEDVICEHQFIMEILDYIYMLHYKLLNRVDSTTKVMPMLKLKQRVQLLNFHINLVTNFGEINDLLKLGLSAYGLENLKMTIDEAVNLKIDCLSLREKRNNFVITTILSCVFGYSAAASLIGAILKYWLKLNPENIPIELYSGIAASVFIAITFLIVYLHINR